MSKLEGSSRATGYYTLRFAAFVFLLYAIDHTPVRPERVVAYFHLGTFGAFLYAIIGMWVLWCLGGVLLGFIVIAFGLLAMPFVGKEKNNP